LSIGEAATGVSREEYIDNVASDILVKLPTNFDVDKTRKKLSGNPSPTSVVLLQELERFNNLLSCMRKSLITLRKVRCRLFSFFVVLFDIVHNIVFILCATMGGFAFRPMPFYGYVLFLSTFQCYQVLFCYCIYLLMTTVAKARYG